MQATNPMANAVKEFAEANPELASRGLGVTTNAERWNGRHAMFGMFAIVMTAFMKGHGLIPDADKVGPCLSLRHASLVKICPTANSARTSRMRTVHRLIATHSSHSMAQILCFLFIMHSPQILDINQWGPLASAGMGQGITNERAIVMIAHVHVLVVSVLAAFAPFQFQVMDKTDRQTDSKASLPSRSKVCTL